MTEHKFRFGVIAAPEEKTDWQASARRAEELGYSSLLVPEALQLLAPFPALAVAGAVTTRLRVGSYVVASPMRPPRSVAWEAHSLSVLLGGRFEFGIGTGRPDMITAAVDEFGLPPTTGADRLAQIDQAITHLRTLDGDDSHTPVIVAAAGPKARALAGRTADIVTLATGALASRDDVAAVVADVRAAAGDRAADIEFTQGIFIVGDDEVPERMRWLIGGDRKTLDEHDSLAVLPGRTPQEMADELRRRRDTVGVTYFGIGAAYQEAFAPVVELLDGQT